ncbi:MAG: hypothetical protein KDC90_01310 [Ignavibacteriae bacterium]|nr:hypothetical protein [Ignavibacteriota bacterium]
MIALLIGTLLGKEITRFLYRPQVVIKFKGIMPLNSDNGFFLSIQIANKGRTEASNSTGNITINCQKDDLMDPDMYVLDKFENALPTYRLENIKLDFPRHQLITPDKFREIKNSNLCWSKLGNPSDINISPGSIQSLDFCRVQFYNNEKTNEKFWYLIFPSEQGWRKVITRIKLEENMSLKGKLFICPNNVFPTVRKFIIRYDRTISSPKLVLKKYNIFEKIYYFFNRSKLYFDY